VNTESVRGVIPADYDRSLMREVESEPWRDGGEEQCRYGFLNADGILYRTITTVGHGEAELLQKIAEDLCLIDVSEESSSKFDRLYARP